MKGYFQIFYTFDWQMFFQKIPESVVFQETLS